jgi:hypothetical protein
MQLMTIGSMLTSVPGQYCRMALARGAFIANQLCGVREAVVCAVFPFSYLNRGVTSSSVRMSDNSRFEESDEVGFM